MIDGRFNYVGVEYEVCFPGGVYPSQFFDSEVTLDSDGSLNPPAGFKGLEVITEPMPVDDNFLSKLLHLESELGAIEAIVNQSCGLHIHINASSCTVLELKKIYLLGEKLQFWFFDAQPPSRLNNSYCKWLSYIGPRIRFVDFLYGYNDYRKKEAKYMKYDCARYTWLNFHSHYYDDRGDIEVRIHSGTTSASKIYNFSKLCINMFRSAVQLPCKDIVNLRGNWEDFESLCLRGDEELKAYFYERLEQFTPRAIGYDGSYGYAPSSIYHLRRS